MESNQRASEIAEEVFRDFSGQTFFCVADSANWLKARITSALTAYAGEKETATSVCGCIGCLKGFKFRYLRDGLCIDCLQSRLREVEADLSKANARISELTKWITPCEKALEDKLRAVETELNNAAIPIGDDNDRAFSLVERVAYLAAQRTHAWKCRDESDLKLREAEADRAAESKVEKMEGELRQERQLREIGTLARKTILGVCNEAQNERDELLKLSTELVNQLNYVHASDAYFSVWHSYANHHGDYVGPTYTNQLNALSTFLQSVKEK
jgi:hypothetical protein